MSGSIAWIAAEADGGDGVVLPENSGSQNPGDEGSERTNPESQNPHFSQTTREVGHPGAGLDIGNLAAHAFPARDMRADAGDAEYVEEDYETQRVRRIYRGRTIAMLRRYMRYSIETGRLPSLLGREFFRTQVTSYTVVTFEDRVIFVHDMERCLDRLDEFSRQIIARHILQEHDQAATGRLLHCTERTVRTYVPITLDLLSEILLEVGLLEKVDSN